MQEIKRIAKFGAVGVINTLIDFVVLDILHLKFGMELILANLISTTIAMVFSFFANRTLVFKHHSERVAKQMVLFWIVTAFGLYVLQSGIIWFLGHPAHGVLNASVRLVHSAGFRDLSAAFITTNVVKLIADLITLVWNYIGYKEFVFVGETKGTAK
ncbi:MAG TPA: GtrA family protein [Candidatus Saccharimonadales bacterium]